MLNNPLTFFIIALVLLIPLVILILLLLRKPQSKDAVKALTVEKTEVKSSISNKEHKLKALDILLSNSWINSPKRDIGTSKSKITVLFFWSHTDLRSLNFIKILNRIHKFSPVIEIIGIHSPRFEFEKSRDTLLTIIKENNVSFPINIDNDYKLLEEYTIVDIPYLIFLDSNKNERFVVNEMAACNDITKLLNQLIKELPTKEDLIPYLREDCPEIHEIGFGYNFESNCGNKEILKKDEIESYYLNEILKEHSWSIGGSWKVEKDRLLSCSDNSILRLNSSIKSLHLVLGTALSKLVKIRINSKELAEFKLNYIEVNKEGLMEITNNRLYKVFQSDEKLEHATIEIDCQEGVSIYFAYAEL